MFHNFCSNILAKLTAFVTIGMDFPQNPPVFVLVLDQDGNERDSSNDVAIRVIINILDFIFYFSTLALDSVLVFYL